MQARKLRKKKYTLREIATALGIKSKTTVSNMLEKKFTPEAIDYRKAIRSHRFLSESQENITAGWIVYRTILRKSTTTEKFRSFIEKAWPIRPKNIKSWIRYLRYYYA